MSYFIFLMDIKLNNIVNSMKDVKIFELFNYNLVKY